MDLADKIKAIYTERDEKISQAAGTRAEQINALGQEWAAFQTEQAKALEAKAGALQARHTDAETTELATVTKAYTDADAKVAKLADDTMAETLGNTGGPTAAEIVATWKLADLKAIAKARGLPVSGKEIEVAQRLLDNGWKPDA